MEGFEEFLGKVVEVRCKDNWFFKGVLLRCEKYGVMIDDRKEGIMFVAYENLKSVKLGDRKERGENEQF